MTTVEENPTSQPRDYSSKPPQRQRRKSRRRGGGDGGNKASQWDTTVNLPEIDESVASIDISELQSFPRNTLIQIAEENFEIETASGLAKQDLICNIIEKQSEKGGAIYS